MERIFGIKGVSAVFLPPENQGGPVTTLFPYCSLELEHTSGPQRCTLRPQALLLLTAQDLTVPVFGSLCLYNEISDVLI